MVYLSWLRATEDCKVEHNDARYSLVVGRSLHGAQEKGKITSSPKDSPQQRGGFSGAQATCIHLAQLQRFSFICFPKNCILFNFVFPPKMSHFIQEVTRVLETYRLSGVLFVKKPFFLYWLFFELSSGYKLYSWALFSSYGTLCLYLWQDCNIVLQFYIPFWIKVFNFGFCVFLWIYILSFRI